MANPFILIHEDRTQGKALIRGKVDRQVIRAAGLGMAMRWSAAGRGWVLDIADVADFCAACECLRVRYKIKQVTAP